MPWLISRAGLRDYGLRATAERRGHRHAADARKETFFAGHAEAERERPAGGCDERGSDQSSSYGKCAGEDEADKDEVNSEDEASGSKGNGSEQSSPCRKCAGEDKGEGEGDSGESGPLVLIRKGTLVIDMTLATEDEKKSQRDWLARCYGADQPSPSASGQPSSTTSH